MGKEHRLAERRQNILTAVEAAGQLSVIELSEQFNVSEVTIRQDLQALSKQGVLLRTRGGALSTNTLPEHSFDVRQQQQSDKKVRIGQAAANLVTSGDTIILDERDVTISKILRNPNMYDGKTGPDPIEPGYRNGAQTCKVYMNGSNGRPMIYSQAHGGIKYRAYNFNSKKRPPLF